MSIHSQIASRIIKQQELIIGPIALDEARKVAGLTISDKKDIEISGNDPKNVIDLLVAQYERLFGKLSRDISKESVQDLIAELPEADIPSSLK